MEEIVGMGISKMNARRRKSIIIYKNELASFYFCWLWSQPAYLCARANLWQNTEVWWFDVVDLLSNFFPEFKMTKSQIPLVHEGGWWPSFQPLSLNSKMTKSQSPMYLGECRIRKGLLICGGPSLSPVRGASF